MPPCSQGVTRFPISDLAYPQWPGSVGSPITGMRFQIRNCSIDVIRSTSTDSDRRLLNISRVPRCGTTQEGTHTCGRNVRSTNVDTANIGTYCFAKVVEERDVKRRLPSSRRDGEIWNVHRERVVGFSAVNCEKGFGMRIVLSVDVWCWCWSDETSR